MSSQSNSISIRDVQSAYKCPAKLFWQYLRPYMYSRGLIEKPSWTPPSISPQQLGKDGEESIGTINLNIEKRAEEDYLNWKNAIGKQNVRYKSVINSSVTKKEKEIKKIYSDTLLNVRIYLHNNPGRSPHRTSKEGKFLVKKYKLEWVLPQVGIYNPVYHYRGRPDFIGLRRDGSTILIDSKNVTHMSSNFDIQMGLYLDSFNRRYLTPSTKEQIPRLAWDLAYLENGEKCKHLLNKENILKDVVGKIKDGVSTAIDILFGDNFEGDGSEEGLGDYEYGRKLLKLEAEYTEKFETIESRIDTIKKPFIDRITDLVLNQKPEYGVVVNIRKPEASKEVAESPIDLPYVVRAIWINKRNFFKKDWQLVCDRSYCRTCPYEEMCVSRIDAGRIEPIDIADDKSPAIPTIIHKAYQNIEKMGVTKIKYDYNQNDETEIDEQSVDINQLIEDNPTRYIEKRYITDYSRSAIAYIFSESNQRRKYTLSKDYKKLPVSFKFWNIK